jgi:hypothetical protein
VPTPARLYDLEMAAARAPLAAVVARYAAFHARAGELARA